MKAYDFLESIKKLGVDTIAGVPDSTLREFCDELNLNRAGFDHYVTANEGAALGLAIGTYLSTGRPACVYMQNSGEGNIINPLASLANTDVYGIPVLFIIGWRGEPGVHDEPQHVFQGKITCKLLDVMNVRYSVIDSSTTIDEIERILAEASETFGRSEQYAIVVKKGTFEADAKYSWDNGYSLNREEALGELLKMLPEDAAVVSTTGKISRELYERSDALYGNHDNIFMTVGGMGHASMIAFGVAVKKPDRRVICVDGDGAFLMHMGAAAFIGSNAPENFVHIVINNNAHESVGGMPTNCREVNLSEVALKIGYREAYRITDMNGLMNISDGLAHAKGPVLYEIMVALGARSDLGRPKESAADNKVMFMDYLSC